MLVPVDVLLGVPEPVLVKEGVCEIVLGGVCVLEGVVVWLGVGKDVGVPETVCVPVEVRVGVRVFEGVGVTDALTEGVAVGDRVEVAV